MCEFACECVSEFACVCVRLLVSVYEFVCECVYVSLLVCVRVFLRVCTCEFAYAPQGTSFFINQFLFVSFFLFKEYGCKIFWAGRITESDIRRHERKLKRRKEGKEINGESERKCDGESRRERKRRENEREREGRERKRRDN